MAMKSERHFFKDLNDGQRFSPVSGPRGQIFVKDRLAGDGSICPLNYARRVSDGKVWFFGNPVEIRLS